MAIARLNKKLSTERSVVNEHLNLLQGREEDSNSLHVLLILKYRASHYPALFYLASSRHSLTILRNHGTLILSNLIIIFTFSHLASSHPTI